MALKDDLNAEVHKIFRAHWATRDGTVVPSQESLSLDNTGVKLKGTVLYADLDGSTRMVDRFSPQFSAEIYKTFLHCCAKIIRSNDGEIVAYDGDRVMAIFIGNLKNTRAAKCALQINYAVEHIINPAIKTCYRELLAEGGFPIEDAPIDYKLLEEIELVRNRTQHPTHITDITARFNMHSLQQVSSPIFVDSDEALALLRVVDDDGRYLVPPAIVITPVTMERAILEVERFCEWFDNWMQMNEPALRAAAATAVQSTPAH